LGFVATIVLIVAGVGLLQSKAWARAASVWYGVYAIVLGIVGFIVNAVFLFGPLLAMAKQETGPAAAGAIGGIAGGVFGGCIGLVYPTLVLIFMTRPHVVAWFDPSRRPSLTPIPGAAGSIGDPGAVQWQSPYTPPAPYATPVPPGSSGNATDDVVATIIPYRNAPALSAYYLGIFSLIACIPFLGIIGVGMAIAAFICGINGLKRARQHPEAKGKVHAWIGIIGGGLCGLVGLVINVGVIVTLIAAAARK
jgi:hypothetical protein